MYANNPNQGVKPNDDEQFRKIFIGGLAQHTTDDSLRDFYSQFGQVTDSIVVRDQITGKSRGFGFITFENKEGVDGAMERRPHEIDQKIVDPKRAVPRDLSIRGEANVSTMRLYVSGIREEHSEQSLSEYFQQFGNVAKADIVLDKQTNKPRGFGFVSFDDYDAVDKCVLIRSHQIDGFRCDVKKALNRDEMARAQQMDKDRAERGQRLRSARNGAPWPAGQRSGGVAGDWRDSHYSNNGAWNQSADPTGQWYAAGPQGGGGWDGSNYATGSYSQSYGGNGAGYGAYNGAWAGDSWNPQSGYSAGGGQRTTNPRNLTTLASPETDYSYGGNH